MVCGVLAAQDFSVQCPDIEKLQNVPGFAAAKKLFFPSAVLEMEQKLAEKNLKLPLERFLFQSNDDGFRFALSRITADQFRYLLKYKILDVPYTESVKENGTFFKLPDFTVRFEKTNGDLLQIDTRRVLKESFPLWIAGNVLNGGLAVDDAVKKQVPFLSNVDDIQFFVLPDTEFLSVKILLYGKAPDAVFAAADAYFKMLLAAAAQFGTVTAAHKEAFKVEKENNAVLIRVKLTPEMADTFFMLLHGLTVSGSANR